MLHNPATAAHASSHQNLLICNRNKTRKIVRAIAIPCAMLAIAFICIIEGDNIIFAEDNDIFNCPIYLEDCNLEVDGNYCSAEVKWTELDR
jgi:hypothetical protein